MTNTPASPWNDRTTLRERQYRTEANLAARQSIYDFQQPRLDLPTLVFDALDLRGEETIIDVGCGNGLYLAALERRRHRGSVLGFDLSPGMLAAAKPQASHSHLAAADASRLPLPDDAADITFAMHMLYHVPEPAEAVRELRRVTRPGGHVAVVLNGSDHLRQIRDLVADASEAVGAPLPYRPPRLTIEVGERLLREEFSSIRRLDFSAELVIPDAEPVLDYVHSMIGLQALEDVEAVRAEVVRRLPAGGPFRVTSHSGAVICS